jgi:hypothetical protein
MKPTGIYETFIKMGPIVYSGNDGLKDMLGNYNAIARPNKSNGQYPNLFEKYQSL